VVGFDDIDFAALAHPPLTTVSLPRDQLGKLAFEALQKILRSERRQGAEYVVETRLVIRESTERSPSAEQEAPPAIPAPAHSVSE
jgi:DNA-binding LacI/PurR family transcriptional regulator